jgi:hypothetical protein
LGAHVKRIRSFHIDVVDCHGLFLAFDFFSTGRAAHWLSLDPIFDGQLVAGFSSSNKQSTAVQVWGSLELLFSA